MRFLAFWHTRDQTPTESMQANIWLRVGEESRCMAIIFGPPSFLRLPIAAWLFLPSPTPQRVCAWGVSAVVQPPDTGTSTPSSGKERDNISLFCCISADFSPPLPSFSFRSIRSLSSALLSIAERDREERAVLVEVPNAFRPCLGSGRTKGLLGNGH